MRRFRCSPVMVVVALFVATSGGAFAAGRALIPGSQIKPHSLPLSALTPSAIAALRGRQGPAGPEGPAGPQAPPGGIDPAKIFIVTSPPVDVLPGTIAGASVSCPDGSVALGGGGNTGAGKLISLVPVVTAPGSSQAVGWAALTNNDTAFPATTEAFVICTSS